MKKLSLFILLLTAIFASCEDPYEGTVYVKDTGETLDMTSAAYLSRNDSEYSLWIELLKYADYYNALNDASTTATVFCPNNEAMREFLEWKGVTAVRELDREYARAVAQIHILPSDLTDETLINYAENDETIPVLSVFGTYISTDFGYTITDVDDAYRTDTRYKEDSIYLNNQAKLEKFTAVKTGNGEVFTMGDVIRPVAETILERLRPYEEAPGDGEYDIFIGAAERCGYDEVVAQIYDTTYNEIGSMVVSNVVFTCLAVPDSVYRAAGIETVDALCSYLGADANYTDENNALRKYVAYHFLDKEMYVKDFFNFQEEGQTNIWDTQLTHQVITCKDAAGAHVFNEVASILRSDMVARNGLIQKIDEILPVWEPDPVTVIWDFCNSADIISFANNYGAAKNLGALFTSPIGSKEYQIDLSENKRDGDYGVVSSFVLNETYVNNSSRASYASYRPIGFVKCKYKSAKEKTVNNYGANMDNLLMLNLGYAGWVEFTTPTIIKGKYKIELYYGGNPVLYEFYGAGSLTKFTLDEAQVSNTFIYKGLVSQGFGKATYGIASAELWKEMVFENSGAHTLRATMMDINAKTNAKYHQLWDYVKFTPIEE